MTDLAVVLISKNQAWNISRLVESVLRETACVSSREIVLVDSASTDETIELARHYPIGILRLRPDQRLTPAAGRYVGYKNTTGSLVLFLDGDMELCSGWLEKALQIIQSRLDVGVVTGQLVDLPKAAGPDQKQPLTQAGMDVATESSFCCGAAIYRRSVLRQVGTFNPYLYSEEEPELCLRIRHAGYRVLLLGCPVAYHYSDPSGALSTLVGRWRRNLYLGFGQVIRYHFGSERLWLYLKERGYGCLPGLGLGAGLASFLWSLNSHKWIWFGLWIFLLSSVIAWDAYRKRSLYRAIFSVLHRLIIVDGMLRGFVLTPADPDSYPTRLDIIKPVSHESHPVKLTLADGETPTWLFRHTLNVYHRALAGHGVPLPPLADAQNEPGCSQAGAAQDQDAPSGALTQNQGRNSLCERQI